MTSQLAQLRKEYALQSLDTKDVFPNPVDQFNKWFDEAMKADLIEVNAMVLSTVSKTKKPSSRIVLLKGIEKDAFIFFTNYESKKGKDIKNNNYVSLLFFWAELERQIRIDGVIKKLSTKESSTYFLSRPIGSQIGAWASPQSTIIKNRAFLEERVQFFEKKFQEEKIKRPPHWGGYSVKPYQIEFWQGRPNRLHDRILYTKKQTKWIIERLAP